MSTKVKATALTGDPTPTFPTQWELLANENQMGPTLKVSWTSPPKTLHPQRKIYVTSQKSWLTKQKKRKRIYFIFQNGKAVLEKHSEKGTLFIAAIYNLQQKSKQNRMFCSNVLNPSTRTPTSSLNPIAEGFFRDEESRAQINIHLVTTGLQLSIIDDVESVKQFLSIIQPKGPRVCVEVQSSRVLVVGWGTAVLSCRNAAGFRARPIRTPVSIPVCCCGVPQKPSATAVLSTRIQCLQAGPPPPPHQSLTSVEIQHCANRA